MLTSAARGLRQTVAGSTPSILSSSASDPAVRPYPILIGLAEFLFGLVEAFADRLFKHTGVYVGQPVYIEATFTSLVFA
jgi:hypothetical protein